MTALFCNGEGMRGGAVHENLAGEPFLGEATTAPRYRFYSVRDEFPGVVDVGTGRAAARSPASCTTSSCGRCSTASCRASRPSSSSGWSSSTTGAPSSGWSCGPRSADRHRDITDLGGWRAYRASTRS